MDKPSQRVGGKSNSSVGREFEYAAQKFFKKEGIELNLNIKIPVGVNSTPKEHAFDLGCEKKKIIVECKSHKWTSGENIPSAKLTVWNEAMYYFFAAPKDYRKIMFVLEHYSQKRNETLAQYYLRRYKHLVPEDVEIWEYNEKYQSVNRLKT